MASTRLKDDNVAITENDREDKNILNWQLDISMFENPNNKAAEGVISSNTSDKDTRGFYIDQESDLIGISRGNAPLNLRHAPCNEGDTSDRCKLINMSWQNQFENNPCKIDNNNCKWEPKN